MTTRSLAAGRRWRPVTILVLLLGASSATACRGVLGQEPGTPSSDEPEIIATIGDARLTRADLEAAVRRRSGGRPVPADQRERVVGQAVSELIEHTLLQAEIERRRIEVSDAEVNDRLAQLSTDLAARQTSLETFLAAAGIDREGLEEQMRFEIAVPKLILPMITDDVMQQVVAMHRHDFDGTRMRASHIVLRPEASSGPDAIAAMLARAERIRAGILADEFTFAEAAERYSAGPSRHRGGDLGYLPRHGLLAEEFSSQVFRLTEGEISKPFVTPHGVHLAKVTAVDPGKIEPEAYRQPLQQLAFQKVLQAFVAHCRQKTPIDLEPGIVAIDHRPPGPRP